MIEFRNYLIFSKQKRPCHAQYRSPLSRRHSLGTEICSQDRYADPECGGQGGPAQKEQLSAGLSLGGRDAEDV